MEVLLRKEITIDILLLRVRCLQRLHRYCTSLARMHWKLLKAW
jgi:hypothetical protein